MKTKKILLAVMITTISVLLVFAGLVVTAADENSSDTVAYVNFYGSLDSKFASFIDGISLGITDKNDPLYFEKFSMDGLEGRKQYAANSTYINIENTFYEKNKLMQKKLHRGYIGFESDSQWDNTIKYYELLMKYDETSEFKKYELPDGFHYEFYKPGDEEEWVMIHIESGEFTSTEMGLKHFHDFYDSFIDKNFFHHKLPPANDIILSNNLFVQHYNIFLLENALNNVISSA